jgi:glycosyltransferase involved in cell wall biosynthesis
LWSFSPITYDLESQAAAAIYHCVDILAEFPGVDSTAVCDAEHALATADVTAIASSSGVEEHLRRQGFSKVKLWENVADTTMFAAHSNGPRESGLVVFAGNLTEHKVDFDLLTAIASSKDVRLVLAGAVAEGGGGTGGPKELIKRSNVDYVGILPLTELASLLGRASVGLIPYQLNDYTAGVFPMKVYEYLGAGLPVVTTALPSIRHLSSTDVMVTDTAKGFVDAVERFASRPPDSQAIARRTATASEHSWEKRGTEAANLITALANE